MVYVDFEYKEIVRANRITANRDLHVSTSRLVIIGYIEKCRSGYFFRPKGKAYTDLEKTKRFKTPNQVRACIKKHYK